LGPIKASLLFIVSGPSRSFRFNPDILYRDAPVSNARNRLISKPSPRIEKGLMGVERYPFLGIKYENESPKSCACSTDVVKIMNANNRIDFISQR
jgi:hypothetical protein